MKHRISDRTRLKRGLGVGDGINYRPWIRPRDFSANSRVHRIKGNKISREHVLLSDLERNWFVLFEFFNHIDIKEQHPLLPLSLTQTIAADHNIPHPKDEDDVIMTTDFVLTIERSGVQERIAFSIKPSSNLTKRVIEKMQIEKDYWESQGTRWFVLTEKELPILMANNIQHMREFYRFDKKAIVKSVYDTILDEKSKPHNSARVSDVVRSVARQLKTQQGDCIRAVKHLIARRVIEFDYHKTFSVDFYLNELKINSYEASTL